MQPATRLLTASTLFLLSLFSVGCGSMCVSTPDCEFHAYGGLRDRQDRVNGRVASLFDPAAASPGYVPAEEPLPPAETDGTDSSDDDDDDGGFDDDTKEPWEQDLQKELDKMNLPSDDSLEPGGSADGDDSADDGSAGFEEI